MKSSKLNLGLAVLVAVMFSGCGGTEKDANTKSSQVSVLQQISVEKKSVSASSDEKNSEETAHEVLKEQNVEVSTTVTNQLAVPVEEKLAPEKIVWKTITLGTGLKTADDFCKALKVDGDYMSDVHDLLSKPELGSFVSDKEIEVDLVVLTTAQLTGKTKRDSKTAEVFAGAARLGLEKCSLEVGPQLRLQYKDQPHNGYLIVGIEPIRNSRGDLLVFNVERCGYPYPDGIHGSVLRLDTCYANPETTCKPDEPWVFVRPRKR